MRPSTVRNRSNREYFRLEDTPIASNPVQKEVLPVDEAREWSKEVTYDMGKLPRCEECKSLSLLKVWSVWIISLRTRGERQKNTETILGLLSKAGNIHAKAFYCMRFKEPINPNIRKRINATKLVKELRRRARSGDMDAQFTLAECMVMQLLPVVYNNDEVKYWLKSAADKGMPLAQVYLCSWIGLDLKFDEATIVHYLKLSADQGMSGSQREYAMRLRDGRGVAKNLEEAERYAKMAASRSWN